MNQFKGWGNFKSAHSVERRLGSEFDDSAERLLGAEFGDSVRSRQDYKSTCSRRCVSVQSLQSDPCVSLKWLDCDRDREGECEQGS